MNKHRRDDVLDKSIYLMLGREVIFLGDHHTFLEEVLVDGNSVLFRHQHFKFSF